MAMSYVDLLRIRFSDDREKLDVEENLRQMIRVLRNSGFLVAGDVEAGSFVARRGLKPSRKLIETFRYAYQYGLLKRILSEHQNILHPDTAVEYIENERFDRIAVAYIVVATMIAKPVIEVSGLRVYRASPPGSGLPPVSIKCDEGAMISRVAVEENGRREREFDQVFLRALNILVNYLMIQMLKTRAYTTAKQQTVELLHEVSRYINEGNVYAIRTLDRFLGEMLEINIRNAPPPPGPKE